MRTAGIDIGSRTVALAVLEDDRLVASQVAYNTHDPLAVCRELFEGVEVERVAATGYGRHLFQRYRDSAVLTEIRAVALGARFLHPDCRAVLDIGGQDTKAVELGEGGGLGKFEMNDRCAAGTGRFLEVMAAALAWSMDDFVAAARGADTATRVNAMCTVFAESEVVSMVARGVPREALALGLHRAVAGRAVAMLKRVPLRGDVLFCGGVARNGCLRELVEEGLDRPVVVPADPQIVAALGCALAARRPAAP